MDVDKEESLPQIPFVLKVFDQVSFTGKINQEGSAEWEWARVPAALNLKTSKDGLALKRGMDSFQQECTIAQTSFNELHYRGLKSDEVGAHTIESKGFLLMIALVTPKKSIHANAKAMAIRILKGLAEAAMTIVGDEHEWVCNCTMFGTDMAYHTYVVSFAHGTTHDLGDMFLEHNEATPLWGQLAKKSWSGHTISSHTAHASFIDLVHFLLYAKCHSHAQAIWRDIGQFLWPQILAMFGEAVEKLAHKLAKRDLEAAPLLKTKAGGVKRIPFANKLLLLRKVRFNKNHRRLVMSSHTDLVPAGTGLVRNEPLLECSKYLEMLIATFSSCSHLQVSWDPSNYSGQEVLVATVWSNQCMKAAYLPIQVLLPVATDEVSKEIQQLAVKKQITRVDGFCELRALAHSLMGIGKRLEQFFLPQEMQWQALGTLEQRVFLRGKFWIYNSATGQVTQQIPDFFNYSAQHILVSISDQGGVNRGVLDYMVNYLHMCVVVAWDGHHRCWNDMKHALRATKLLRTFLSFAMMFNINYGPMNSKTWWEKKKNARAEFAKFQSPHSGRFLEYTQHICNERLQVCNGSREQREHLWAEMEKMRTLEIAGPLAKLMRWWSWWECHQFYSGELWLSKLIMTSAMDKKNQEDQASAMDKKKTKQDRG